MNATMNRNGQQRKSLASQIDRLDALLDGLADGLNDAVASVVKEAVGLAVQEAVRAVLTEVLQNADLRAQLRQAPPTPAATPVQTPCRWLRSGCQFVRQALVACQGAIVRAAHAAAQRVQAAIDHVVQCGRRFGAGCRRQVTTGLTGGARLWRLLRVFPGPLLTALAVGAVTGCVVYHAGPWVSGVIGGLGGFVLSGVLHLGIRLRSWLPLLLPD